MDFLPALRDTGIFNKKRPMGMPDIDNGGLGDMLRELGPLASSMEDDDLRRKKDLLAFEASLRNPGPQQPSMMNRMMNRPVANTMSPVSVGNAAAPQTSMQRQLQARDDQERSNKFKQDMFGQETAGKLTQAMEEGKLRNAGQMEQIMAEMNARKEMGAEERGSRERISQNELAARVNENATERASRASEGAADRTSRENIAKMPARVIAPSATQQGNAMDNRLQQLVIDNPAAAAILTKDQDTGHIIFKPGSDPKQQEFVRNYLKQGQQQTSTQQPNNDRVTVIGPDGKVGTIPRSQLAQAARSGYKEKK